MVQLLKFNTEKEDHSSNSEYANRYASTQTIKIYVRLQNGFDPIVSGVHGNTKIHPRRKVSFYWVNGFVKLKPGLSSQWSLVRSFIRDLVCISFVWLTPLWEQSHTQLMQKKSRTKLRTRLPLTRKTRLYFVTISQTVLSWSRWVSSKETIWFHLHLIDFPFFYQFSSRMATLVESTCWNPAKLSFTNIWKHFDK